MKIDLEREITKLTAHICLHWHRSNNPTLHHTSDTTSMAAKVKQLIRVHKKKSKFMHIDAN